MRTRVVCAALAAVLSLLALTSTGAAPEFGGVSGISQLQLRASLKSGQPVGTTVLWAGSWDIPTEVEYRLEIGRPDEAPSLIFDYDKRHIFPWTPLRDGTYVATLSARSGPLFTRATREYQIESRVTNAPLVTSTQHPLVALYSAPPCEGAMRVAFRPLGSSVPAFTDARPCEPGHSANFLIAGMTADSTYLIRHEIIDEGGQVVETGPRLVHQTGSVDLTFPTFRRLDPPDSQSSLGEPIVLHAPGFLLDNSVRHAVATDLGGNVLWYYEPPPAKASTTLLTRPVPGGTMLFIGPGEALPNQVIWEADLAGNILKDTSAQRVSEQLAAKGQDPIGSFHHEVTRLPNGQTVVLGTVERIMTDVQGPGPVDILGTMVIALDENWEVIWAWNAFDHLDVTRKATLGETCSPDKICPPLFLAEEANDWLHSNSIGYSPADGDLIISVRNQDWVIKIDYNDGRGTGQVVWKLGREGDFAIESDDPYPWFTHQHDVRYVSDNEVVLYDNGNLRCETTGDDPCHSRGQALILDENQRVATLEANFDLNNYSPGFGAAQRLANGNYLFTSGYNWPRFFSTVDEFLPSGDPNSALAVPHTLMYRSYRLSSLYAPDSIR